MPSPAAVLPSLVAPVPADEFLKSYWPLRPLIAAPHAGRSQALLAARELQDLPSLLRVHRGSTRAIFTLPSGQYREAQIPSDAALRLFEGGMTICLSNVEQCVPIVASWVRGLAADLGLGPMARAQCNAYVSPTGRGFAKHCDDHEVFVVQLWGKKRWRIAENHDVPFPLENYIPANGRPRELASYLTADASPELPEDATVVEMSPGSALFLPRGTWHETDAQEYSLSLSFGVTLPSFVEIVLGALRRKLVASPEWRAPVVLPAGGAAIGTGFAERLAELARAVGELAPHELVAALEPAAAARFRRVPGRELLVEDGAGAEARPTATILERGQETTRIVCEPGLVTLIREVGETGGHFSVPELVARGHPERSAAIVVATLVKAGFLERLGRQDEAI